MKKFLLLVLLTTITATSFACDICGCSSGNYFMGPFPQFRKHFVGLRYTFRTFTSHVAGSNEEFSKDFYQTTEIWGGINMSKKWQVLAFIPYSFNRQSSDEGIKRSNGISDITLLSNYKVVDTRKQDTRGNRVSQQLWVGAGVKMPTGKFAANPDDIIPDANNQPGSGSVDLVLNGMYTFHINDWGINSNLSYKINNEAKSFKFGNRFSSSAFAFHTFNYGSKATINPNVGILYDNLQANHLNKEKVEDTGGYALLGAAGAEMNFNKIAIGLNTQLPIAQNLSNHQTKTNVRGMLHITFLL
jgi:hypothetical protein